MWGPTAWGAFSPGHVGHCCHNLCLRCGPHPALFRSAAPSGCVVNTGRLNPGFLVLLVLPLLLEAHVNQRPCALRASGQDREQDAPRSRPSAGFLLRARRCHSMPTVGRLPCSLLASPSDFLGDKPESSLGQELGRLAWRQEGADQWVAARGFFLAGVFTSHWGMF